MRFAHIIALASLLFLFGAREASACSCAFLSADEQLQQSDRVFSGVVVSVEEIELEFGLVYRALIAVHKVWKGDDEARVAVDTKPVGSCSFTLAVGGDYLVYADATGESGIFSTHECNRTRLSIHAEEDLVKLGEPLLILSREEGSWAAMKARFGDSNR
jgi:hypothetical protein